MVCGTMKNRLDGKSVLELGLDMQKDHGWITDEDVQKIASLREMDVAKVYETLSFYSMILLKKPATIRIEVCRGTSCYSLGGINLLKEIKK
ncbi:hypothetical protein P261_00567 [Lachnospiraceae bacterium TWA4]|nr:hypothetical protein P261_00567 [Lachnospiraceae bacterium TWA4]